MEKLKRKIALIIALNMALTMSGCSKKELTDNIPSNIYDTVSEEPTLNTILANSSDFSDYISTIDFESIDCVYTVIKLYDTLEKKEYERVDDILSTLLRNGYYNRVISTGKSQTLLVLHSEIKSYIALDDKKKQKLSDSCTTFLVNDGADIVKDFIDQLIKLELDDKITSEELSDSQIEKFNVQTKRNKNNDEDALSLNTSKYVVVANNKIIRLDKDLLNAYKTMEFIANKKYDDKGYTKEVIVNRIKESINIVNKTLISELTRRNSRIKSKVSEDALDNLNGQLSDPFIIEEEVVDRIKYIVKDGDTILGLCAEYGFSPVEFYRVNPKLKSDTLEIGQRINIPTKVESYIKK